MQHDIFISYSRRNLAAVKTIKEELESLGFSCWMDLEGIESGSEEQWGEAGVSRMAIMGLSRFWVGPNL